MLTLEMLTATGRDDGERLEREASPVVDALFQLRLTAAIRAAGGRGGAAGSLCDLQEVSPFLSDGLDYLTAGVTAPDVDAKRWLRENGVRLESAFNAARLAHMTGTAMKMNAVGNFGEFRQMARRPDLRDFEGTSEDIAITVMSAKARGAYFTTR